SYAGTRQQDKNYRTSTFGYTGPDLTIDYAANNAAYPRYMYQSTADSVTANSASNYALSGYSTSDHLTTGRDFGGGANALLHYGLREHQSQLTVGVRHRAERLDFTNRRVSLQDVASRPLSLQQVPAR